MIFGYDVGSTTGNIVVLVILILTILWLGLSMAYCISRKEQEIGIKGRARKSRRQKFEEYWGDIEDSAHSTTGLYMRARDDESQHSSTAGANMDLSMSGLMNIPLGGDGRK